MICQDRLRIETIKPKTAKLKKVRFAVAAPRLLCGRLPWADADGAHWLQFRLGFPLLEQPDRTVWRSARDGGRCAVRVGAAPDAVSDRSLLKENAPLF
jgi:hypothetical protein